MPRRQGSGSSSARKTSRRSAPEVAAVIDRRERLVAEIASLRKLGQASALSVKAERLLTRWWARANWEARERLLASAEWLLRVECNRGAQPSA